MCGKFRHKKPHPRKPIEFSNKDQRERQALTHQIHQLQKPPCPIASGSIQERILFARVAISI